MPVKNRQQYTTTYDDREIAADSVQGRSHATLERQSLAGGGRFMGHRAV